MKYVACTDITATGKAARTRVNDITMYFQVHGEGEPLLLLYGDLCYIEYGGRSQIPALAEHYQVIAPDLCAHGRTTDSDRPLSRSLMASDVAELLDQQVSYSYLYRGELRECRYPPSLPKWIPAYAGMTCSRRSLPSQRWGRE